MVPLRYVASREPVVERLTWTMDVRQHGHVRPPWDERADLVLVQVVM